MTEKEPGIRITKGNFLKLPAVFIRWVTEPSGEVSPEQRLPVRMLSAFLLLMAVNTLTAALSVTAYGGNLWKVILATSAALFISYFINRTRFHKAAIIPALILPAVPPVAVALFQPPQLDLVSSLMWFALPLLAAGIIMPVRHSHFVALTYIILIIVLALSGFLDFNAGAALIIFLIIIAFFVIAFTSLQKARKEEIENQLTELQQYEKTLKESEGKYRALFEYAKDAVILTDWHNGLIMDANPTAAVLLGKPREMIIGMNHSLIHPPEKAEDYVKQFIRHTDDNKETTFSDDLLIQRDDGTRIPVNVSTSVIELAGKKIIQSVYRDMTERNAMINKLQESEETMSKAFHASPDAISISDLNDGTFIEINDSYTRITGYTREDILHKSADAVNMWVSLEDRERIARIKQLRTKLTNEEMQFRVKSGEIHTALVSIDYIQIAGQDYLLTVSADITEYKRAKKALDRSEQQLAKVFRLTPQQTFITRPEDGLILDANDNFYRISGYTPQEAIGHTSVELGIWAEPEDRLKMLHILDTKGRVYNQEYVFCKKSGESFAGLFSAEAIEINGEQCLVAIITDISEQKRTEKALKESEEKFSKTFQAIPERISISRVSDGLLLDVNDSFWRTMKKTREETVGHTVDELHLWEPGEREKLIKRMKKHGGIVNQEITRKTQTGEMQALLFSADIITIGDEPCMISISNDITERKKMEQALKESEEKFSKAFRSVPESIAITRIEDGMVLDVNDGFCVSKGYKREYAVGKTAEELRLWRSPEDRRQVVRTVKEKGSISNLEYTYNSPTGEMKTILFSADIINIGGEICMISISNDITERKKMEQALKESEEKFSKAFHYLPEAIAISRVKDGVFIDANNSFCLARGYTREETIGHTASELKLPDIPQKRELTINRIVEEGSVSNMEYSSRARSGETRTYLLSADIINISGEPCMISIANDITERKKIEEKLKQALTELELSSASLKATNKELESFSYSVSHDLRSPLRSIDGFSQALLDDYAPKLDETAKDYLKRMRNASQKMGELIDGILKLSRLTRGEMHREKVDLSDFAREISVRLQETNPDRKTEFIIGKDLSATGDPQMLRALMENLLGNAWKFTEKVPVARIEFGSVNEKGKKVFYVRDNGAGFDMAYKDKLFNAFQRLHNTTEFSGTGIGLATVQRIINRHGGSIRAEGEVGRGATFYFYL